MATDQPQNDEVATDEEQVETQHVDTETPQVEKTVEQERSDAENRERARALGEENAAKDAAKVDVRAESEKAEDEKE